MLNEVFQTICFHYLFLGKTTSVSLVCKELGFDVVEFNASDTRSKKLLQDEVGRLLRNTSLTPYFSQEGDVSKY